MPFIIFKAWCLQTKTTVKGSNMIEPTRFLLATVTVTNFKSVLKSCSEQHGFREIVQQVAVHGIHFARLVRDMSVSFSEM